MCKQGVLNTRADVVNWLEGLFDAFSKQYISSSAGVDLGNTGYHYSDDGARIEAFSRIVWALGPYIAGGGDHPIYEHYLEGISNGTNPEHPDYFGAIYAYDQRSVELAALSFAILLDTDKFFYALDKKSQKNYVKWLDQINHQPMGGNNWQFFRVLTCLALERVGYEYDDTLYNKSLELIDTLYVDKGWFIDGATGNFDYYNPFAFHFYSMVYYKEKSTRDIERCERYKDYATKFASEYTNWISNEGSVIPYGRSLTYRFGAVAYYAVTAYAGIEVVPYGLSKQIVLNNLSYWMNQDILDRDGILTIGYCYPNLIMSEPYNAPGSPYWGLKTAAMLALPEDHPFWASEPEDIPVVNQPIKQEVPGFIIQRLEGGDHVVALSGKQDKGRINGYFVSTFAEKYGKFAYSTRYGFSISRSMYRADHGAFDSMLAVRVEGHPNYAVRLEQELIEMTDNSITSKWTPLPGVEIITTLTAKEEGHVRRHVIKTDKALETLEGGFAIKRKAVSNLEENTLTITDSMARADNGIDQSLIEDIEGNRKAIMVVPEPNTNLINNKTLLPMLEGHIPVGETTYTCFVYAGRVN